MTVRWDDLPADTRRRLGGAAKAKAKARATPERVPRPVPTNGGDAGWTYRCHTCGRLTTDWATAERHVNTVHRGGTTELLWPGRPGG